MNRKGAFSILVNIIFIVIGILVAWSIFMPILGSLFNNPQASTAYDNFETLTLKIERLLDDKSVVKTNVMFFDMSEDYVVIAFDYNQSKIDNTNYKGIDVDIWFEKPEKQKGKAGLCIFLWEKIDYREDNIKNSIDCKWFEKDAKFYSYDLKKMFFQSEEGFRGEDKNSYPDDNAVLKKREYKYVNLVWSVKPIRNTIWRGVFKDDQPFRHELYIEVVEDDAGVKHVLVGKASSYDLQARYKFANTCPNEKGDSCYKKHFDEVIKNDLGEKSYCHFDKEENTCVKQEDVKKCGNKQISRNTIEVCNCGGTAFSDGFCVNEVFAPRDIESCSSVASCSEYTTAQNCVFNTCRGPKNSFTCFWDKQSILERYNPRSVSTAAEHCISCDAITNCAGYKENELACNTDPCGVLEGLESEAKKLCVYSNEKCTDKKVTQITESLDEFQCTRHSQYETACLEERDSDCIFNYENGNCNACNSYSNYNSPCKSAAFIVGERMKFYDQFTVDVDDLKASDPCGCRD